MTDRPVASGVQGAGSRLGIWEDAPSLSPAERWETYPAPFEKVQLTAEQQRHVNLMRSIAQELTAQTGDNLVLKAALLCCWPTVCRASRSTWTSTAEDPLATFSARGVQ